MIKVLLKAFLLVGLAFVITACSSPGLENIEGNEGGSAPINAKESTEYKRALLRCYRTGGSRIVKIEGQLRCY